MKRYALVDPDNKVTNVIVWDEASPWSPPEGHIMVKVEDIICDIGWIHDSGTFTKPPEPEPEPDPAQQPAQPATPPGA